ncbi:MAG TPA: hypothetical protein VLU95_00350 [Candidatus Acidoferrum sp.]|nr:hypothetical protein [Candidatus Acidoferrum sp.]
MKTLKISDDTHSRLTTLLGELTAETSKLQTYQDAINALMKESVLVPAELIVKTENFISENKDLGYTTKEEFVRDAIRFRLNFLKNDSYCIEISQRQFAELDKAVKEMNTPFKSVEEFIISKINEILEEFAEYKTYH